MQSLHIAILNVPRPVHINPTLSLVATLGRRGHHVTYGTSMEFESKVRAVGAEPVRVARLSGPWKRKKISDEHMEDDAVGFFELANMTLRYVLDFYTRNVPDLIIYDTFSFVGKLLAEKFGVPAILATPQFEMNMEGLERQGVTEEFKNAILAMNVQLDLLHEQHGIKSSDALFQKERLNIYYFIKEYQIPGILDDEKTIYAGRCPAEQPYPVTSGRFFNCERPTALVSTSTTYVQSADYYRMCARVLSDMGWQVILAPGGEVQESSLQSLPPHCVIAEGVPLASVMPQANLLVCLGGPITTMEALYHGLPLILLSHGSIDAELYANSVPRLGCGVHLAGRNVSSERVGDAVLKISSDTAIHARVKELQRAVRNSLGAEEVANYIEEFYASTREKPVRSQAR